MQVAQTLSVEGIWTRLPYDFPRGASGLSTDPAIYCWFVDAKPVYVGQADNLKRRTAGYESPGPTQMTNIRLHSYLHERLRAKQSVELRVLSPLHLNRIELPPRS